MRSTIAAFFLLLKVTSLHGMAPLHEGTGTEDPIQVQSLVYSGEKKIDNKNSLHDNTDPHFLERTNVSENASDSDELYVSFPAVVPIFYPDFSETPYGKPRGEYEWLYLRNISDPLFVHNGVIYYQAELNKLKAKKFGSNYRARIFHEYYDLKLGVIDEQAIKYFTQGACWALMKYLGEKHGLPMMALRQNKKHIHGLCQIGDNLFIDITGLNSREWILNNCPGCELVKVSASLEKGLITEFEPNSFMTTKKLARIFGRALVKKLRKEGKIKRGQGLISF